MRSIGAKVEANAAKDPVTDELEKAVELRTRTLARLKQLSGTGSITESSVRDGELALVAAKAELAKSRREAGQGGSQRLADLRRRLDDTAIDLAEATAKQKAIKNLREQAPGFNGELESMRLRIEQYESDCRAVSADLTDLRSKLRRYTPPLVEVFQSVPAPADATVPAN